MKENRNTPKERKLLIDRKHLTMREVWMMINNEYKSLKAQTRHALTKEHHWNRAAMNFYNAYKLSLVYDKLGGAKKFFSELGKARPKKTEFAAKNTSQQLELNFA